MQRTGAAGSQGSHTHPQTPAAAGWAQKAPAQLRGRAARLGQAVGEREQKGAAGLGRAAALQLPSPPAPGGTSPFIASRTTPPSCALRRMRSSALPPLASAAWLWRRRRRQDGAHQVRPVGPSQAPHGPRCRPPASLRLPGHRGGLRSALGPRSGAALQGRGPPIGPGPAEGAGPRGAEGGLGGGVFGEGVRGSRRRL